MDGPQTVIIDGYNLIKRVPALAAKLNGPAGLEGARSYLLGSLRAYQARRGRRVVLVLDGPRIGRSDFGPVEVHYAPIADQVVVRLATPSSLVVSSDLAVRQGAIGQGAEVLSSEDFWQALTVGAAPGLRAPRLRAGDGGRDRGPAGGGREHDHDGAAGARRGPSRGNPKRKSKAERRREQARINLMRKV